MHKGTKVRPCTIGPGRISLFCQMNRCRPDDDFMSLGRLPEQPFKILKDGAVSADHVFGIRAEISADPPLSGRDHLLPLPSFFTVWGFIRGVRPLHLREAGFYLRAIRFGVLSCIR